MTFRQLSEYFDKLENTSSRISITKILAELFNQVSDQEIDKVLYLLQGRVTPLYQRLDFGMGEKMVAKSILKAMVLDRPYFIHQYKKIGDLGKTVEYFKKQIQSFDQQDLNIIQVYQRLYQITQAVGEGSVDEKVAILSYLIQVLDPLSCRYLVRIPVNTMRLGFSDMTILDSLSWMITNDKTKRADIEKAYHVRPDLGLIGKTIKAKGFSALNQLKPQVFTPIIMMKAERLSSADEILKKAENGYIENKLDGFRLQVHYKKGKRQKEKGKSQIEVKLYSRNLDDVSYMYPDIVKGVKNEIKAQELIFEGEAIGYDPKKQKFLPFQETVQRKRKYDIEKKSQEIPLKLFVFEILYQDGKSLLKTPFYQRRQILEKLIKPDKNLNQKTIFLIQKNLVKNKAIINQQFKKAANQGYEGIMIKKKEGIYQPGARGWNWIKYKRSYQAKAQDTIDCLVMGYDWGKGKRTSFGIGAFLVGVLDEKTNKYKTIAKIGTGLTDKEWIKLEKLCSKYQTDNKPSLYQISDEMKVDVWVKPAIVVEIRADEITRSSTHTAGRSLKASKSGKAKQIDSPGYALRFPRLEKFRPDKRINDITTQKELIFIYKSQSTN